MVLAAEAFLSMSQVQATVLYDIVSRKYIDTFSHGILTLFEGI